MKPKGLRIVKKVSIPKPVAKNEKKEKYPTNIGKPDFVMDGKTFLTWYDS